MKIAVIAITRNGAKLAHKMAETMTGAGLYVSDRYVDQSEERAISFKADSLKELIASLWNDYTGFVFIMATGIVVRMIAPLLKSKQTDPAVVVIDDTGKFAISLLSGHLGGANELAERCAAVIGAQAVITTATDANNLPSFDMLAKEQGWSIDDISRVKRLNSLLLDNEEIAVVDPGGQVHRRFQGRGKLLFFDTFVEAINSRARGFVFVTNRHLPLKTQPENLLILRPRNLVLGIGCNRGTPLDEIDLFVQLHLRRIFLSIKSVSSIASACAKRDEPGLREFAARHAVPILFFESKELNQVTCPSQPSQYALDAIGAKGVAEPAAILGSGGGRLLLKKVKSDNVTLAVAQIPEKEVLP